MLDLDLRRDDPVLGYDSSWVSAIAEFPVDRVGRVGDAYARFECLLEPNRRLRWIWWRQAWTRLLASAPGADRHPSCPRHSRHPRDLAYAWSENPLGIMGYLLVSRGEKTPWRLHLRTPSFAHVQVLRSALAGHHG